MQANEELVKKVIEEVLQEVLKEQVKTSSPVNTQHEQGGGMKLVEKGVAKRGSDPKEVVIAIPPAFGTVFTETITGISLSEVLRQVFAGIEEEGLKPRLVRVYHTVDVGFIAHQAAKLSGSGIGIGILSRGTTVIHQRDLNPLNNLELFPQSPVMDLDVYRAIGRNAAKYAKGEHPTPVITRNDPQALTGYQARAALLHNKEMRYLDRSKPPMELEVRFE